MERKKTREWAVIGAIVFLLLAVAGLRTLTAGDLLLASGSELMSDDFGVTPLSCRRVDDRVVLRVRVTNHARRVPFTFDPSMVLLSVKANENLHAHDRKRATLQPGESVEQELTFDGTEATGPLIVRFAVSGTMGDFFEGLLGNHIHEEILPK